VLIRELQSLCLDVELIKRADLIKKGARAEIARSRTSDQWLVISVQSLQRAAYGLN